MLKISLQIEIHLLLRLMELVQSTITIKKNFEIMEQSFLTFYLLFYVIL